jgi:hypothetical protein
MFRYVPIANFSSTVRSTKIRGASGEAAIATFLARGRNGSENSVIETKASFERFQDAGSSRERIQPAGSAGRIALPIAGDHPKAKAVVAHLIDELGFDAVDAGGLDESWQQQPGTPVYGTDLDAAGVRLALSQAKSERDPAWRAVVDELVKHD